MDAFWIVLGVVILVVTFLDTFLAVLNYDEAGILVNRVVRWQWVLMRSFTQRVSRRWRPLVLRQVTGVLLLTTILGWICGMVLGFAFIYLGLIGLGAFQIEQGVMPDFVGALYLSVGQFATVGADNISPAGGWVNLVPVLEALMSVVLLSFTITFLSNIYGVIQLLRSLCADFFQTGPGVGSPTGALRPYFPDGRPRDIDRHLNELADDFNLYCDSLRQDHAAYLFQSGEDQFSLPFALYMTSGVVGALTWGLPSGHDATKSPSLVRVREAFDDFRVRRYRMMRWPVPAAPQPVSAERFAADSAAFDAHASRLDVDPWVLRFLALNREMANMIGAERPTEPDDPYRRYVQWLAFARPAQQFVTRVARDLDYQPVYVGDAPVDDAGDGDTTPVGVGGTTGGTAPTAGGSGATAGGSGATAGGAGATATVQPKRENRAVAWLRRRLLFLDPGSIRLREALRALGAVVVAVALAAAMSVALRIDATDAGVFAALIAAFSVPLAAGRDAGRLRIAGLLALVPVGLGIVAGAFVPREPVAAVVVLALVATGAIWLGRFGRRWAVCGRLAFLAYYFALLLAVTPAELLVALAAAGVGVVCAWLANLVPSPRGDRVLRAAVGAVAERVSVLVDAAVDALSGAGDRRLGRVLHAEDAALRDSVTSLTALLDEAAGRSAHPERLHERQLRAFDVQLAAGNLLRALPRATDDGATVDVRSRLAGELVELQRHLQEARRRARGGEHPTTPAQPGAAPSVAVHAPRDDGPAVGAPLRTAIRALSDAVDALLAVPEPAATHETTHDVTHAKDATRLQEVTHPQESTRPQEAATRPHETAHPQQTTRPPVRRPEASARVEAHAVDRRAVQGGLATGLALLLGSFVSPSHQLWAAMPAFQALTESDGERLVRTLQRLIGTVVGAAAGFGLALATGHDARVAFVVVVASVFFMSFLRTFSAPWTALWQTVLLATLYDLLARLDAEAIQLRVVETLIGAVVALLVAAVILPTRTRGRVLASMSAFVAATANVTHAAIQRLADPRLVGDGAARQVLAEGEAAMQRELDGVLAYAAPLRLDPGAMQHSGIQPQLTALTALAFTARRLVAVSERGAASATDPGEWQRLDEATRDDFQAALVVLDGRLPATVADRAGVDASAADAEREPALALVTRIDAILLGFMASLRPGSTDPTGETGGG